MTTSQPSTLGELQLYRVLQRANLLVYYDAFIQQGGDDVQQLCDAAEEEFLEIMALVGMSSKPLHVRRLQKALQEWITNPTAFNQPLTKLPASSIPIAKISELNTAATSPNSIGSTQEQQARLVQSLAAGQEIANNHASSRLMETSSQTEVLAAGHPLPSISNVMTVTKEEPHSPPKDGPSLPLTPDVVQIIGSCAERLIQTVPRMEPKELECVFISNKKMSKTLGHIFEMSDQEPQREEEIRKFSAIYGRFDSKRKDGKNLTLHEVMVNEAAAQLCLIDTTLLARRDELFPLARQVVRDSGYKYSHRYSRSKFADAPIPKRPRLDPNGQYLRDEVHTRTVQAELMKLKRQERLLEIQAILAGIYQKQETLKSKIIQEELSHNVAEVHELQLELEKVTTEQLSLMQEQNDLIKKQKRSDKYFSAKARSLSLLGMHPVEEEDGGMSEGSGDDASEEMTSNSSLAPSPCPSDIPSTFRPCQSKTKQMIQLALIDEGLRVAQQHASPSTEEGERISPRIKQEAFSEDEENYKEDSDVTSNRNS
ncbi:NGFI-A-binding protein 1-like isoform X1 [Carcharodon carcharias]|uniref:NGFI-A-binding protein 1-like isoform X1 n=1 Tax=Carcharodon carcharias TaxID=13397 RepID=UPI001B7EE5E4|nr:NGFI-A-binding protein 1-like isoform X1 [Carcharodon carcharias]XP_041073485.1 NGFI-A-binding protein 1-like isoform X1 [Carcharodon carcharias]XP_041073486.1 NGFI-A-binding protein 1-like isoform X1 [Carcharodon carcharias]XP_041073487.1 NGFI-A-binding protein 1-like isoform X1 [Carcharodon carcharias]XP_041073488.1 NGFI-A-binding protein 1-like isoform X1 [Carcharodon carcharias]